MVWGRYSSYRQRVALRRREEHGPQNHVWSSKACPTFPTGQIPGSSMCKDWSLWLWLLWLSWNQYRTISESFQYICQTRQQRLSFAFLVSSTNKQKKKCVSIPAISNTQQLLPTWIHCTNRACCDHSGHEEVGDYQCRVWACGNDHGWRQRPSVRPPFHGAGFDVARIIDWVQQTGYASNLPWSCSIIFWTMTVKAPHPRRILPL